MKLIIDIPEEDYKILKEYILNEDSKKVGFSNLADAYKAIGFPNLGDILARRVINGTPIPDNATNGDVIKAIFNCKTSNEDSNYLVKYSLDGIYEEVNSNWWNAEYQKNF